MGLSFRLCSVIRLCLKINSNCGGSYIDSPDWIKNIKNNSNGEKQVILLMISNREKCEAKSE